MILLLLAAACVARAAQEEGIRIEVERVMPHYTRAFEFDEASDSAYLEQVHQHFQSLAGELPVLEVLNPDGKLVAITNVMNTQYMGQVYFGYPMSQNATVVFDTGSNWLVVTSSLCPSCSNWAYNPADSNSKQQVGTEAFEQKYGSADLFGYEYKDFVCLAPLQGYSPKLNSVVQSSCLNDYSFMAITKQAGLNKGVQGILGLGASGDDKDKGPSFIEALYKNKRIRKALLSFSLGTKSEIDEQKSYLIFGGINHAQIEGDLHTFALKNNHWWALDMNKIAYNGHVLGSYFGGDQAVAVVDTGTSLITVPSAVHR